MEKSSEYKNAIVLAMFGTSVEHALAGLLNIRDKVVERFPETQVRIAFTSNIIRRIWHKRAQDLQFCEANPEVPGEVLKIRDPFSVIDELSSSGYNAIIVQPVFMTPVKEYRDLLSVIDSLMTDNTVQLVVGRPALGSSVDDPAIDDIFGTAEVLASDARYARERKAALLYMGHGSKQSPTGTLYKEFAAAMQKLYPDVLTLVATVEGSPTLEEAILKLQKHGTCSIILKPLMVVAGNHARNDMTGDPPRGWKNKLEQAGFEVEAVQSGLGEQDTFAQIFADNAADAARDTGIELR